MGIYRPSHIHDALVSILDSIEMESDPMLKVAGYAYLQREFRSLFTPARDRAAYLARQTNNAFDIADVAGTGYKEIYNWSLGHSLRTGDPAPPRRHRHDVSHAIRLAVDAGLRKPVEDRPAE